MTAPLPGPPELLPGRPDAIVDLQTAEGAALVGAQWRHADARIREIDFVGVGEDLGPSGRRTAPTTSTRTPSRPTTTTPTGPCWPPRTHSGGSAAAGCPSGGTA